MGSASTLFAVSGGGGGRGFNQIQTVGQTQPLGDYSPETQAKLAQAERRRQITNLLVQKGLQGGPPATSTGRFIVPRGAMQNLGDLATLMAGLYGNYQADQSAQAAIAHENEAYEKAITGYKSRLAGVTDQEGRAARPAIPAQPATITTGQSEDDTTYTPPTAAQPAIEAVPASTEQKQKAILEALLQSRIPAVQRYGFQQQAVLDAEVARSEAAAAATEARVEKKREFDVTQDRLAKLDAWEREKFAQEQETKRREGAHKGERSQWTVHPGGDGFMYRTDAITGQSERVLVNGEPVKVPAKEHTGTPLATDEGYFEFKDGRWMPILGPDGKPLRKPVAEKPLSATLTKQLLEDDDIVRASENSVTLLQDAIRQSGTAYSGYGAGVRSTVASNIPFTPAPAGASAAIDIDNLVTGQALGALRATFGAAPTEGERKILLDVQGSISLQPEQREKIWKRAIEMAEKKGGAARREADSIREGTYLKPHGAVGSQGVGRPSEAPDTSDSPVVSQGDYAALPTGAHYRTVPGGPVYIKKPSASASDGATPLPAVPVQPAAQGLPPVSALPQGMGPPPRIPGVSTPSAAPAPVAGEVLKASDAILLVPFQDRAAVMGLVERMMKPVVTQAQYEQMPPPGALRDQMTALLAPIYQQRGRPVSELHQQVNIAMDEIVEMARQAQEKKAKKG